MKNSSPRAVSGTKTETVPSVLAGRLETLYVKYNKPEYIHPDPLELVVGFKDPADREIAALIASSLAYGRVNRILFSVSEILKRTGGAPSGFIMDSTLEDMRSAFAGFKHRFHSGDDIAMLLHGAAEAVREYGSLEKCFAAGLSADARTVAGAEAAFSAKICRFFPNGESTLLPSSVKGSACKRLNLMLRWLVRSDAVDPGGWDSVPASKLIVPLDTHMHRLARTLGLTKRNDAGLVTALEITECFSRISPSDPVKFDFPLTRFGINPDFPLVPEE